MENEYLNLLAQVVLPAQILEYFAIVGVEQTSTEIHISLDERMQPALSNDVNFESKLICISVEVCSTPTIEKYSRIWAGSTTWANIFKYSFSIQQR